MSKRRKDIERPWWPVAERMRRARLFAGIETQPEMAARLDVSRAQLNKWESGTMEVPKVALYAYAYVADIAIEWLLDQSEGVVMAATGPTITRPGDQSSDLLPGRSSKGRSRDVAAAA